MNAKKLACAPEDIDIHELWSKIDWNKCERLSKSCKHVL